ncbi:MAG: hypothetical protein HN348_01890, partial [Proteobacteria bacterium]|nr:hypothetical protein [Pseudomonadota bacterium]
MLHFENRLADLCGSINSAANHFRVLKKARRMHRDLTAGNAHYTLGDAWVLALVDVLLRWPVKRIEPAPSVFLHLLDCGAYEEAKLLALCHENASRKLAMWKMLATERPDDVAVETLHRDFCEIYATVEPATLSPEEAPAKEQSFAEYSQWVALHPEWHSWKKALPLLLAEPNASSLIEDVSGFELERMILDGAWEEVLHHVEREKDRVLIGELLAMSGANVPARLLDSLTGLGTGSLALFALDPKNRSERTKFLAHLRHEPPKHQAGILWKWTEMGGSIDATRQTEIDGSVLSKVWTNRLMATPRTRSVRKLFRQLLLINAVPPDQYAMHREAVLSEEAPSTEYENWLDSKRNSHSYRKWAETTTTAELHTATNPVFIVDAFFQHHPSIPPGSALRRLFNRMAGSTPGPLFYAIRKYLRRLGPSTAKRYRVRLQRTLTLVEALVFNLAGRQQELAKAIQGLPAKQASNVFRHLPPKPEWNHLQLEYAYSAWQPKRLKKWAKANSCPRLARAALSLVAGDPEQAGKDWLADVTRKMTPWQDRLWCSIGMALAAEDALNITHLSSITNNPNPCGKALVDVWRHQAGTTINNRRNVQNRQLFQTITN